jgi:hypothetical protein
MDADGNDLKPVTPDNQTAIVPAWGPNHGLFFANSKDYRPF